jgi:nicotinamidase-related amidase
MRAPVLIVIDMLNDFLDAWPAAARRELIAATNALVETMRRHERPVIWMRQEFRADLSDAFLEVRTKGTRITIEDTPGSQIAAELAIAPSDPVLVKKRYSAFFGTALDQVLAEFAPDMGIA